MPLLSPCRLPLREVIYTIKKIDTSANTVTINTLSGATIDSASSALLNSPSAYANIASDGSNYWITGSNALIAIGANPHIDNCINISTTTSVTHSVSLSALNVTVPQSGNYLVWYSARAWMSNSTLGWFFKLFDTTSGGSLERTQGNNINFSTTNGDNKVTQTYFGYLTAGHILTIVQTLENPSATLTVCMGDIQGGGPSIHMVKIN